MSEVVFSIRNRPVEKWVPAEGFCPDCGGHQVHRKMGQKLVPVADGVEAGTLLCPDCGAVNLVARCDSSPDNDLRRNKVFMSLNT